MDNSCSKWRRPKPRGRGGRAASLRKARTTRKSQESAKPQEPAAAVPNLQTQQPAPGVTPKTRSGKKLRYFEDLRAENTTEEEYLLFHSSCLQELVEPLSCPECHQNNLKVIRGERQGFCVKFKVICSECDIIVSEVNTSKRCSDSTSSRPGIDVNVRMSMAFLDIGSAHQTMTRFCSAMQMNPLSQSSFYEQMKKLTDADEKTRQKILEEARKIVRQVYQEMNPNWDPTTPLRLTVSIDGSWHKRGFKSLYGFIAVIDIITGLVIDCIILSKFCLMDVLAISQYGEETETYKAWKREHDSKGECSINFEGPSGNMESDGAVILFKRSIESGNMMYVSIMADGDAKTLAQINNAQPYGPNITITKEECINHVSKRMATGLKEAKKSEGLGGRGEGNLTDDYITKLQGFYHKGIKENLPDVKKMQNAVLASLYHCASTDEKPQHQYCPKGSSSWCFYNKRKALKVKDLGEHKKMPVRLNDKVFKALLPRYKRLSSKELMERCCSGGTTNANECLHSSVWKKAPKHLFMSRNRLEYAVTQAVGEFNMGCTAFQALKSEASSQPVAAVSQSIAESLDRKRLATAEAQDTPAAKRQRILKKFRKTRGPSISLVGMTETRNESIHIELL